MHQAPPLPRPAAHRPSAAPRSLALLTLCFLALLVAVALSWRPLLSVDRTLADAAHRWAVGDPGATGAVRLFSDWVWDPWTMRAVLAVTAGVLVWRGARGEAVLVAVAAVAGGAVSQAVKAAVGRPRPVWTDPVDTAPYAAFPSGHALGVAVCGGLLLWLLRRRGVRGAAWGGAVAVAVVSAVGVGATRVWLGVHWPSDVLGGWLLGGVVVTGTVTAYHLLAGRAARSPGTPRTPG